MPLAAYYDRLLEPEEATIMQKVTVRREELLERLRHNRDNHRTIFEKALDGYRERLLEELEGRLEDLRKGRKIDQYIGLPEPEDHTSDYDRVITMVEMSISDEIELSSTEFAQFVMDQWSWREGFVTTASNYTQVQ
jgi:hypothetical protein